jgi:hypothetical protein
LPRAKVRERLLGSELVVLNLGLDIFGDALESQGVRWAQVDLHEAPKLERKLSDALDRLL